MAGRRGSGAGRFVPSLKEMEELRRGLLLPGLARSTEQRAFVEGAEAVARLPVDDDGLILVGAADPIPAE